MAARARDFRLSSGIEKAYIVGALCTQLQTMVEKPYCFANRDAEICIQLVEQARASLGAAIDEATQARVDRVITAAERAVAAGKLTAA